MQPSERCCKFIRNPEPQTEGNDFVFQFDLFSFLTGSKFNFPV